MATRKRKPAKPKTRAEVFDTLWKSPKYRARVARCDRLLRLLTEAEHGLRLTRHPSDAAKVEQLSRAVKLTLRARNVTEDNAIRAAGFRV